MPRAATPTASGGDGRSLVQPDQAGPTAETLLNHRRTGSSKNTVRRCATTITTAANKQASSSGAFSISDVSDVAARMNTTMRYTGKWTAYTPYEILPSHTKNA